VDPPLTDASPSLNCYAYVQLLLATGSRWPYAEEFTPLYGIGKAYREAWKVVRQGLDARSPWWPFAENGWNEALGARGWPGLP